MSERKLDLSNYERDVVEHMLFGMARARIFEDAVHGKSWNVDLPAGRLDIGGRKYEAQILGTFAPGSKTFLWAWANPGNAKWGPSLVAASRAKMAGAHPGYAVLAEREVAEGWVHPRELAYTVGELTGGHPVYAPTTNGTTVYLLANAPIDPRTISPAYLPGLLLDFHSFAMGDRHACVARFFERLGFQVARTPLETLARRSDGVAVRVSWSPDQDITNVSLDAGR